MEVNRWRQFQRVDLDLSRQTTILTGPNGSGKTTLLNALSMHFGWSLAFVATPRKHRKLKSLWSDVHGDKFYDSVELEDEENARVSVGSIRYSDGSVCDLSTEKFVSANYQLQYGNLQGVDGLYIPSHRPMAVYNPVSSIPTNPVEAQDHYQQYQQFMLQLFGGGNAKNPGMIQKQALISFAVFGEGNSSVPPNHDYFRRFRDFEQKLRITLPKELGFRKLEVRSGDLVLVTRTGDFSLDAMSGGVNAIFGIVWQISMFSAGSKRYTVIIDEPENHLHPSMQRSLLPSLAKAYPDTRFIISTHSPFILTSFPEASVYGLFLRQRRIYSERLEMADLSGTPNRVLREILGVDSTLPLWVEEKVESVMDETEELSPEARGKRVLETLNEMGISSALSEYRSRPR